MYIQVHTTKLQLRLPADVTSGAIHTIPAPNLSVKDNKIQFFSDSQKEAPKNPFKRPVSVVRASKYDIRRKPLA